jgi:AcrR family transcriptional regulator
MSGTTLSMRERILDAAFSAFMRLGYGGASTSEIARLAQVSKRDLYAQFGSKHAMLTDCIIERARRMRRDLTLPAPTSLAALRETLIAFGVTNLLEISQPEVLATFRLAISEAESAPEVARALDTHGRQETERALIELLTSARDLGWLHGAEPEAMARLFSGVLMGGGLLVRLLMGVAPAPDEAAARQRAEAATTALFGAHGAPA